MIVRCVKCGEDHYWKAQKGQRLSEQRCPTCRGAVKMLPHEACAECGKKSRDPIRPRFVWRAVDRAGSTQNQVSLLTHPPLTACCWRHKAMRVSE
jgi:DNA-directed RNA polymerase subunit RPC12/RpoP